MSARARKAVGSISQKNEFNDTNTDPWAFVDQPPNLGIATEQDTVLHDLDNVETKLKAHD